MSEQADHEDDFEHGWQALAGLAGRVSAHLRSVQGTDGYAPVSPWEVVPVEPCPFCADGGLRMAGYVTRDHRLLPVRQCDTCHAVEVGVHVYPGDERYAGDDGEIAPDDADGDEEDEEDEEDEGDEGPWRSPW